MSSEQIHTAETRYRDYHLRLLREFIRQTQQQPPFIEENCPPEDLEFLGRLEALPNAHESEDFPQQGQQLLTRAIAAYAHLVPLLPRDLLWFFGGDCLHFMPDEEIALYQQLDERLHQALTDGRDFHYEQERAEVFGLH